MEFTDYQHKFKYIFGVMYCYNNYVVGHLLPEINVDNNIVKSMLTDINDYYGKEKIVFISNREFGHEVNPKVYKLVNPKTMIGIAIVGTTQEQKIQAATEQSLYSGYFGYFNNMKSAISWENSFTGQHDTRQVS